MVSRIDRLLMMINEAGVEAHLGATGEGFRMQQNALELAKLIDLCLRQNVHTVLEIGTGSGGLARFMVERLGWNVTSVDIERPAYFYDDRFNAEFINADSQAPSIALYLNERKYDLVIIDGDHSEQGAAADWRNYKNAGRIIAIHDIEPGRDGTEGAATLWKMISEGEGVPQDSCWTTFIDPAAPVGWGVVVKQTIVKPPPVTALVSVYHSSDFLAGCLDDLLTQDIQGLEIVIALSGTNDADRIIATNYATQYQYRNSVCPYIRVIETERETLYAAWNRMIAISYGRYLTNANTDDRHAPFAFTALYEALEQNQGDIAYGCYYCTSTPNAVWGGEWEQWRGDPINYPDGRVNAAMYPFDPAALWSNCFIGPQPMWRAEIHALIGDFDESFAIASDYEFWCRMAAAQLKFMPIPLYMGLFYFDESSNLSQVNSGHLIMENRRIRLRHASLRATMRAIKVTQND